jgi:hypothetical protein
VTGAPQMTTQIIFAGLHIPRMQRDKGVAPTFLRYVQVLNSIAEFKATASFRSKKRNPDINFGESLFLL